jgi:hypothetical protein
MIGISQPSTLLLSNARFQRDYLWDVILPDIGIAAGGLIGFGIGSLVQSVSFGDYSIDTTNTMKFGPYEAHFAGLLKVPTVKMKFLKTIPDVISTYFNSWKNLIIGPGGTYYPKNNYARTIYIRFNDATGLTIGQYKLVSAFPITFPNYTLDYAADKLTEIEIEFQIDQVEYSVF